MSRSTAIVSAAQALMQRGTNVIDAFRQALTRVPAARASRLLAARLLGAGKPANVARHLRAMVDEDDSPKAPAADVRAGALLECASRLRKRAAGLHAAARSVAPFDHLAEDLADELDLEADHIEECARTGKAVG